MSQQGRARQATFRVMTVCTGNICRSPMAEVLLRTRLAERGVDASVASAGTLAWGGPATANSCIVVDELGVNLRGHLSQQLTADLVGPADLVLGMTRDHVWRATRLDAGATDRSFLIGELVRLGRRVGPRAEGEPVRDWAARVAAERVDGRPIGQVGDEVADPVGEPIHVYRATAARLDHDVRAIAELLVPTP
jgi:protein-tyrosine phosphatase